MTHADAIVTITNAGLTVGVTRQLYDASVPVGQVITQSPAAGVHVRRSTRVDVWVSKGPQAPQAAFGVDIQSGMAPLQVHFSDLSFPGTSAIKEWHWDFGDGFTSNEPNPTYTYKVPGTYSASLIVSTDAGDNTASASSAITVTLNSADTDSDGVPDVRESVLGSDPNNSRDGGGQLPATNHHQVSITGGSDPVTVTQANYTLTTERITASLPGSPDNYALVGGLNFFINPLSKSGDALLRDFQISQNGEVSVSLNTDATALLQLKDSEGNLLMYTYFPKHADLRVTSPNFDYLDCAASLVYSQPLLVNDNAIYSAVILQIIKQLPETGTLAGILEAKMVTKPNIMVAPDEEVMCAVASCVSSLMTLAEQRSKHLRKAMESGKIDESIMKILLAEKSDTNNDIFHDMDGRDGDKVDAQATFTGNSGTFGVTNNLTRWVTFYMDQEAGGLPSFNGQYVGIVDPRAFELPTLKDLVIDAIISNLGHMIWDLFTDPEDILQNAIERAIESVTSHFATSSNQFSTPVEWRDPILSSYSIGRNTGLDDSGRCFPPLVLTVITEALLPAISVVADLDGDVIFDRNGVIHNFTATSTLLAELGGNYGPDISEIFIDTSVGTLTVLEATGELITVAAHMTLDPVLWEYLSRHGPLGPDLISAIAADTVEKALGLLVSPLEWLDTGVNVANLCIASFNFVEILVNEDRMDLYAISLPQPVTLHRFSRICRHLLLARQ